MFDISGSGYCLPTRRVTTAELADIHGYDAARLLQVPGIKSRYYCSTESQVDLAVDAAKFALNDAGLVAADIDLVISACGVSYQPLPSLSPLIMAGIGAPDGSMETLDINTTCLSFVTGFELAAGYITSGRCKRILVVSAEVASRGLPWHDDPETAALFGDGAAAVVLSQGNSRIAARSFKTYPSSWNACQIASGGTRHDYREAREEFEEGVFFRMNGKELFKLSAAGFPKFTADLLETAGWNVSDVDVVIPHQAGPLALRHMTKICGFDPAKIVDIVEDYGNMIAASVPLALSLARKEGRVSAGDKVLFLGTSAGVSFGGLALEMAAA